MYLIRCAWMSTLKKSANVRNKRILCLIWPIESDNPYDKRTDYEYSYDPASGSAA